MIRLGQAEDGRLILGTNEDLPGDIVHVEYYRAEKMFNLVFEDGAAEESLLMPCEVDEDTARIVRASPNVMVIALAQKGLPPCGYAVPLIQIGV